MENTEINELFDELKSNYVRFELIKFETMRRLVVALDDKEILKSFTDTYMSKKPINYLQIKTLKKIIEQ
tara:strand:- start:623 stop:829 length:207 start_codon:yes stop_codon:yes gene_type:complete